MLTEHNEVEFRLKATRSAKDFTPAVGAKIPKGVKAQSLPTPVLSQMPELRDYLYVKMKDRVLIVNGMTNQIVDMFPETQPRKSPPRRWDQFSKSRWCAWRFGTWGTASTCADSFSDLATYSERASPAEVGDQIAFARILLKWHFRLFQRNRSKAEMTIGICHVCSTR